MRTDGQTDRHDEANSRLKQFCELSEGTFRHFLAPCQCRLTAAGETPNCTLNIHTYVHWNCILWIHFLRVFAKLRKAPFGFVMFVCLSVRRHVTTQLPLDRYLSNLIFNEGEGKGKVHPRTGHEGPEGE